MFMDRDEVKVHKHCLSLILISYFLQPPKAGAKGKKSPKLSKAEKEKLKKEEAERKAREEGELYAFIRTLSLWETGN